MPVKSYQVWTYVIVCDQCQEIGPSSEDQAYAERKAETQGWTIDRNSDDEREWRVTCPRCIKAQLEVG